MQDIEKMLESRMSEISAYITEMQKDREDHLHRTAEIEQQTASAEKNHERCRRALQALKGDNEPKAVKAEIEAEFGIPQPTYRPGRDR